LLIRHQQLERLLECGRQHSIEAVLKLHCAPRRDAAGDRAATLIFLAEGLKPKTTGKKTSAAEMSATGVWSQRNPNEATAEQGQLATEALVDGAIRFIERWKQLEPPNRR
jgi:creatinine amidohydrolase/Fe(II)-dependent formamide hydrolase-like protein